MNPSIQLRFRVPYEFLHFSEDQLCSCDAPHGACLEITCRVVDFESGKFIQDKGSLFVCQVCQKVLRVREPKGG
jgi:hypothetical protein